MTIRKLLLGTVAALVLATAPFTARASEWTGDVLAYACLGNVPGAKMDKQTAKNAMGCNAYINGWDDARFAFLQGTTTYCPPEITVKETSVVFFDYVAAHPEAKKNFLPLKPSWQLSKTSGLVTDMTGKLTALQVTRAKERGTYGDGNGLYLQVARGGTRSWILRYKRDGKTRHLGLGSLSIVSLREARQRAVNARRLLLDGHDPIERKSALRSAEKLKAIGTMSFDACAAAYMTAHRAEWRSAKHAADWVFSLKTYASPVLGTLPVRAITTPLVMRVIEWRHFQMSGK